MENCEGNILQVPQESRSQKVVESFVKDENQVSDLAESKTKIRPLIVAGISSSASPPARNLRSKTSTDLDDLKDDALTEPSNGAENLKPPKGVEKVRRSSDRNPRRSVLAQLIDDGKVELGAKVTCGTNYGKKRFSSGEIVTRDGIQCHCCSVVFTPRAFAEHMGEGNLDSSMMMRDNTNQILLNDGRSIEHYKDNIYHLDDDDDDDHVDPKYTAQYEYELPVLNCCEKCEKVGLGLIDLDGKPFRVGSDDNLTWKLLRSSEYADLVHPVAVLYGCLEDKIDQRKWIAVLNDILFGRKDSLNCSTCWDSYVVVLERGKQLIAMLTVSVLKGKVAEIVLVATQFGVNRPEMCRIMVEELRKQLRGLGLEKLRVPSADSVLGNWFNMFGVIPEIEVCKENLLASQETFSFKMIFPGHPMEGDEICPPKGRIDQIFEVNPGWIIELLALKPIKDDG